MQHVYNDIIIVMAANSCDEFNHDGLLNLWMTTVVSDLVCPICGYGRGDCEPNSIFCCRTSQAKFREPGSVNEAK